MLLPCYLPEGLRVPSDAYSLLLRWCARVCVHGTDVLPADKVGQGTYQDELMSVAAGSLERVVDVLVERITEWSSAAAHASDEVLELAEVEVARL